MRQKEQAEKFHHLHHAKEMLVLPNAWDCASAKIFENAGFPAIATTSSGVSWSCGYQDGERIPPELMLEVVSRIARTVQVPVTADIEGGYTDSLEGLGEFVKQIIDAGAVGINLEDSSSTKNDLNSIEQQVEKIKVVKKVSGQNGINLFLNARIDALMYFPGSLESKIQACIERAKVYANAGADGIFVPFVKEIETVALLKKGIDLPLNILIEDTLDVSALRNLKVNRVSTGSKPILASLSLMKRIGQELRQGNDWSSLMVKDTNYAELNQYFK